MTDLVLSVFPGIGLLDEAFELEGFCVVRGPDLLWGGDIRRFHPPPGRFGGVIGGPPCQRFSRLAPVIVANGYELADDLIPEFVRVVEEAAPVWWLMENVERAPVPTIAGYETHAPLYDNRWLGGEQSRRHRFTFGTKDGRKFYPEQLALEATAWSPRVCARGIHAPQMLAGGVRPRRYRRDGTRWEIRNFPGRGRKAVEEAKRLQGLPPEWDLPGFRIEAKMAALGNAVPLPMGRALARAVRGALA
jgi:DNA (cytosine-5)-methyltransferase 1